MVHINQPLVYIVSIVAVLQIVEKYTSTCLIASSFVLPFYPRSFTRTRSHLHPGRNCNLLTNARHLTMNKSRKSRAFMRIRQEIEQELMNSKGETTTTTTTATPTTTRKNEKEKDLSHIPLDVQKSLESTGYKYFCKKCNVGFQKQKNYQQHLEGKKHLRVVSEWESANRDYLLEAPTWSQRNQEEISPSPSDMDEQRNDYEHMHIESENVLVGEKRKIQNITKLSNDDEKGDDKDNDDDSIDYDVCTCWRDEELKEFPHRCSCIDHSLVISTLSPKERARFWRYLRDSFGKHYPEFASILHHVSLTKPQYLRVKELFENLEAFKIVSSIIIMAQDAAKKIDPDSSKTDIDVIYDLACGHGLLGILLAYRFPTKKVICVDLEQRESFYAFRDAFNAKGESYEGLTPLSNLEYREADLLTVESELTPSSCLVALHACNEANKHVADMAKRANAAWAVMPCCIRSKLYLGGAPVLDLDGETRYKLLCGAFAEANNAKVIRSIPRDITARPILIAGGFLELQQEQGDEDEEMNKNASNSDLPLSPGRHEFVSRR